MKKKKDIEMELVTHYEGDKRRRGKGMELGTRGKMERKRQERMTELKVRKID